MSLLPGGYSGVLLKPKMPSIDTKADIFGFNISSRNIFNVIFGLCIKKHHKCIGNNLPNPQITAMKLFFHLCIASYVVFILYIYGGMS